MIIKEIKEEEEGTLNCAIKKKHILLNEYTNDKYLQDNYDMKIIKRQPNGKKRVIIDAIATNIIIEHQHTPNSIQWNDATIIFQTKEGTYREYQLTPETIIEQSSKDIHTCYYDTKHIETQQNTTELILTTPLLEYINTLILKSRKQITEYVIKTNNGNDDNSGKIKLLMDPIETTSGENITLSARINGPYKSQLKDTVKFNIITED